MKGEASDLPIETRNVSEFSLKPDISEVLQVVYSAILFKLSISLHACHTCCVVNFIRISLTCDNSVAGPVFSNDSHRISNTKITW